MQIIKNTILLISLTTTSLSHLCGQSTPTDEQQRKAIAFLIDQYSEARENRDTILLKRILTEDVDQLVSTGEWRNGTRAAVEGMLKSSAASPGTRMLRIEKIRMLNPGSALVDCKYEILNENNTIRKMWSTFVIVADTTGWKISAIRNMLPANP